MKVRLRKAQGLDISDDYQAYELYDLRDDISETHNVIDQHPEIVAELSKSLADYIKNGRSTPGQPQSNEPLRYAKWPQINFMEGIDDK
ncbi:hypothetical protein D3X11_02670 [Streptococcus sp. X16XC17]|nr:hypothetical protein D3X11_02670 [Streptococcus sp. X16XC17]